MKTRDRNTTHLRGKTAGRKAARQKKEAHVQIQYAPAKPFNRNRFLLHLATVLAVVLAVVLVMSIFFKVEQVMVSGSEKYTPWEVKEAAGIQNGDALLSLSEAKITASIQKKLPYVGDVRIGIKLPNTVNIEIKELEVVYAVQDDSNAWWLMDKTGRIVDSTNAAAAKDYTCLVGVQIQEGVIGQQAVAYEKEIAEIPSEETEGLAVPTLPPTPAAQLLDAAIEIFSALEGCGVMGTVDSVDVTQVGELTLNYDSRYVVTLGDTSRLSYKISAMKASIEKMGQYQGGYLDVSFTVWPNEVGYRPFEEGFDINN